MHAPRPFRLAVLAIALVTLAGCWGITGANQGALYTPQDATEAPDLAIADQVADAKKAADAAPSDAQAATHYAEMLGAAYVAGTVTRGRLAGDSMRTDALAKLDAAANTSADPQQAAELLAVKGRLYANSGMPDAATTEFEASMERAPNLVALAPLIETYAAQRRHDEIDSHCTATREVATDNDSRFAVLAWCASARPGMTGAQALPWASAEDVTFYEEQVAIEQARAQAEYEAQLARDAELAQQRAIEDEARRQAEAASAAHASSSSSTANEVYSANVTVDSDCRETVHIFEGSVSGNYTGSGTYGRQSANSITSYHLFSDDQLCLITESRDILSCVKPQNGARLRIPETCSGFLPD